MYIIIIIIIIIILKYPDYNGFLIFDSCYCVQSLNFDLLSPWDAIHVRTIMHQLSFRTSQLQFVDLFNNWFMLDEYLT